VVKADIETEGVICILIGIVAIRQLRSVKLDIFTTATPSVSCWFMVLLRKFDYFHSMLKKSKIFSKINDRKSVSYIFLGIFYSEIKPFIIAFCIGIIMQE